MMNAPEVYTQGSDGPERAYYYPPPAQQQQQHQQPLPPQYGSADSPSLSHGYQKVEQSTLELAVPPKTTIFGFQRAKFFLLITLALVVVLAAVGGGVGGSIAAAKMRESSCPTANGTATTTVTVGTPGTTSTANPSQTTTLNNAIVVPTAGAIAFDCAKAQENQQVVSVRGTSWGFEVKCQQDYNGPSIDIMGTTAYSFGDCLRSCASLNSFSSNNTCLGVYFSGNISDMLPSQYGNCFLKKYLTALRPNDRTLGAAASLVFSPLSSK
ncbi:hypothetical protein B0T19DRAFT_48657 [Cercophora scortea]|uniref:Apple domain-containing protein n=1 Tax=Cercophora scortea TaxID=314031 RepID=A0AAE0J4D4_9PEZI|nr:hypothetical protein B0T19DRAFT_48657 [Cercophora scortea]